MSRVPAGPAVAFAAMLGVLALVSTAHAEPPPVRTVAIIELGGGADSAQLAGALRAAAARTRGLDGIADPAVAAALVGAPPDEDSGAIAAAGRALAGAQAHLARFEPSAAAAQAQLGSAQLLGVTPGPTTTMLLAELAFTEGLARLADGGQADAAAALALAHALEPTRTLDPAQYVPEVLAAYAAARADGRPPGTIAVEGDGAVWLDGRVVGRAPLIATATAGAHLVVVFGAERLPRGARLVVEPGAVATFVVPAAPAPPAVQVARARRALLDAPDATARAAAIARIATLAGASDALLLARDDAGRLTVQWWRDRAPGFGPVEPVGPRDAAALLAPLAPPVADDVRPPPPPPRSPPAPRPWWRRGGTWALVGGGALAVALTSLALLGGDDGGRGVASQQGFVE